MREVFPEVQFAQVIDLSSDHVFDNSLASTVLDETLTDKFQLAIILSSSQASFSAVILLSRTVGAGPHGHYEPPRSQKQEHQS